MPPNFPPYRRAFCRATLSIPLVLSLIGRSIEEVHADPEIVASGFGKEPVGIVGTELRYYEELTLFKPGLPLVRQDHMPGESATDDYTLIVEDQVGPGSDSGAGDDGCSRRRSGRNHCGGGEQRLAQQRAGCAKPDISHRCGP